MGDVELAPDGLTHLVVVGIVPGSPGTSPDQGPVGRRGDDLDEVGLLVVGQTPDVVGQPGAASSVGGVAFVANLVLVHPGVVPLHAQMPVAAGHGRGRAAEVLVVAVEALGRVVVAVLVVGPTLLGAHDGAEAEGGHGDGGDGQSHQKVLGHGIPLPGLVLSLHNTRCKGVCKLTLLAKKCK